MGARTTYEQVGTRETGDPALKIPFTPIGLDSNPKPTFPPGGGSIISGEGSIAVGGAGITTGPPDTPPPPTQKWLRPGDTLITTGEAFIRMEDGTLGWLAPGSQLMVLETSTDGTQVRLDFGRIAAKVRSGTQFRISTPGGMVIVVYGTEFLAAVDEDGTLTVNVTEGIVSVRSAGEYVILSPGESVAVFPGEPPPDPVDLSPVSVIGQVIAHFAMPDEPLPDAASLSAAFGAAIPWGIGYVVVVLLITVVIRKNQRAAGWQHGKHVSGLQRGKQGTKIIFRVRDGQFEVRLAWRTKSDLIPLSEITSAEITDLTGIGLLGRGWTRTQDRFLVMHYAPGNVIAAITVTARLPALETAQREITAFLAVHPRLDELRDRNKIAFM
ncbi:MAG: FecR domain-containing protein [Chloroflexi bacterium]|nr:FecR domain-containing protein [Chloroflexota bacterium]